MQNSYVAARSALMVAAILAAPVAAQTNLLRKGADPRIPAVAIEKANTRPVSRVESSIKEYEALVAKSPGDAILLNNLGANYFLAGRVFEAQSLLRKAAKLDPRSLPIRVNLAIVLNKAYNPELAVRTLEGVLAERPDDHRARQVLCEIHVQQEHAGSAIACYGVLFGSGKMDTAGAGNFATLLIGAGQIDRAAAILRWADNSLPEDAGVKNGIGVILFRKKKFAAAEAALQRAVTLEPNAPQVRYNLAMVQMASNKRGAVLEQYKFLKVSSPELASKLYQLLFRDKIVRVRPE